MNFSYKLVELLKKEMGLKSDLQVCQVLPKITSGNLSQVKSGNRHLTDEQALFIAEKCSLDSALTLVELAAECAKTETAQTVWHNLAKKLKAATSAIVLTSLLLFSSVSGHFSPKIRNIP